MREPIWLKVGSLKQYYGPEWLKNAWQSCILPCEKQDETTTISACGIMPKDYELLEHANPDDMPGIPGFCIRQDIALNILQKKLPAAAAYYRDMLFPQPNGYFLFEKGDVEIVGSEVSSLKLLH